MASFQSLLDLTGCNFEVLRMFQLGDTEATVASRFLVNTSVKRGLCFIATGVGAAREALTIGATSTDFVFGLVKSELLDAVCAAVNVSKTDILRDSIVLPKKTSVRLPLSLTRQIIPFVKSQLLAMPGRIVVEHIVLPGQNSSSIARMYGAAKEKIPAECFPGTSIEVPVGEAFLLALHPLVKECAPMSALPSSSGDDKRWVHEMVTATTSVEELCRLRGAAVDEIFVPNFDRLKGRGSNLEKATFAVRIRSLKQLLSAKAQGFPLWGVDPQGKMASCVAPPASADASGGDELASGYQFMTQHSRIFAMVTAAASTDTISATALNLGVRDLRDVIPFSMSFNRSVAPTVTIVRSNSPPDSFVISFVLEHQFLDIKDLAADPAQSAKLVEAVEVDILQVCQCMVEDPVNEVRAAHTYFVDYARGRLYLGIRVKSEKSANIIRDLVENDGGSVLLPKTREFLLSLGKIVPHDEADLELCLTMKPRVNSVRKSAHYAPRQGELTVALGLDDTLADVALEHGVSVASLMSSNGHIILPLLDLHANDLLSFLTKEKLLPLPGSGPFQSEETNYEALMDGGVAALLPLRKLLNLSFVAVNALMTHTSVKHVTVLGAESSQSLFNFAAANGCQAADVFADCAGRPGSTIYSVSPAHTTTLNGVRPTITTTRTTIEPGQSLYQLADSIDATPRDLCIRNASAVMVPRGCVALSISCTSADSEVFVTVKVSPTDTLFTLSSKIGVSSKAIASCCSSVLASRGSFLMLVPVCDKSRELLLSMTCPNLVTTAPPYPDETIASNFEVPVEAVAAANIVRFLADKKLVPVVTPSCTATCRMQGLPLYIIVGMPREGTVSQTAKRFNVPVGSVECGAIPLATCGVTDITVPVSLELASKLITTKNSGPNTASNTPPMQIAIRIGDKKLVPPSISISKLPSPSLFALTTDEQLRDHKALLHEKASSLLALSQKLTVYDKYVEMVTSRIARSQAENVVVEKVLAAFKAANLLTKADAASNNMNVQNAQTQTVEPEPEKPDANSAVLVRTDMANPVKKPRKARDTMTNLTSRMIEANDQAVVDLEKRCVDKELQLQALRRAAALTEASVEQLQDDLAKAKTEREGLEEALASSRTMYNQLESKHRALEAALLHDGEDDEEDEEHRGSDDEGHHSNAGDGSEAELRSGAGDSDGAGTTISKAASLAPPMPIIVPPVAVTSATPAMTPAPKQLGAPTPHGRKSVMPPSAASVALPGKGGSATVLTLDQEQQHRDAIAAAAQAAREAALEEAAKQQPAIRKKAVQKFLRAIYSHGRSFRQAKEHLTEVVEDAKKYVPYVFQQLFQELEGQMMQLVQIFNGQMNANDAVWMRRLKEAEAAAFAYGVQSAGGQQQQMVSEGMRNAVQAAESAPNAREPQMAWAQHELKQFLQNTLTQGSQPPLPSRYLQQQPSSLNTDGLPASPQSLSISNGVSMRPGTFQFESPGTQLVAAQEVPAVGIQDSRVMSQPMMIQQQPQVSGAYPMPGFQRPQPMPMGPAYGAVPTPNIREQRVPTPPPNQQQGFLPPIARTGSGRQQQQQQPVYYPAKPTQAQVVSLPPLRPSLGGGGVSPQLNPLDQQQWMAAQQQILQQQQQQQQQSQEQTYFGLLQPMLSGMPPAPGSSHGRSFSPTGGRSFSPSKLKFDVLAPPKNARGGSALPSPTTHTAAVMRGPHGFQREDSRYGGTLSPRPPVSYEESLRSPKSQNLMSPSSSKLEFVPITRQISLGARQQSGVMMQKQSSLIKTQPALDVVLPVADAVVQLGDNPEAFLTADEKQRLSTLQQLDSRRRHDKNKLIFQNIVTRMETERLIKLVQRSVAPESGELVSLFVTDMWKKWLQKWNERRLTLIEERGAHLETLASIFVAKARASSALSEVNERDDFQHASSPSGRHGVAGSSNHLQGFDALPTAPGDSSHHFKLATLNN